MWPLRKSYFIFKFFCRDGVWTWGLHCARPASDPSYAASSSVFVVWPLEVTLATQQLFPRGQPNKSQKTHRRWDIFKKKFLLMWTNYAYEWGSFWPSTMHFDRIHPKLFLFLFPSHFWRNTSLFRPVPLKHPCIKDEILSVKWGQYSL